MNNDLKTTVLGLIAAVATILNMIGINIPHSTEIFGAITAIAIAALAFFTNKPDVPKV